MKILKWFWIVLTALCFIGSIAVLSYVLLSSDSVLDFLTNNYLQALNSNSGYSVSYDSIETNSLNKLDILNLSIQKDEKKILSTSRLTVSTSLIDFIRLVFGSSNVDFNFNCSDLYADLIFDNSSKVVGDDTNYDSILETIKKLNGSINVSNGNVSIRLNDFDLKIEGLSFIMNFKKDYKLSSLSLDSEIIEVSSEVFSMHSSQLSVRNGGKKDIYLSFASINCFSNQLYFKSNNLSLDLNYSIEDKIIGISSSELRIDTNFYDFNYITFKDLISYLSLEKGTTINRLEISSNISGNHSNPIIDDFVFDINASTNIDSFKSLFDTGNYNGFEITVSDFNCASFEDNNNFYVTSENLKDFSSKFNISDKVNGNISYSFENFDTSLRLYISSLKFSEYKPLFDFIEKYAGEFSDIDTQIDGSIVYKGKLDLSDLNGIVSINLIGQNIIFANQKQTVATSFEAVAENNKLNIDTLALTALGKRLSYSGSINLNNFYPEGKLVLQDSKSFDEIARIIFNLDEDKQGYTFLSEIASLKDFRIDGHVNLSDKSLIYAYTNIETQYNDYSFDFNLDVDNHILKSISDNSNLTITYLDNNIELSGELFSVPVCLSNNTIIHASADLSGNMNLDDFLFNFSLSDSEIKVSDILNLVFDIEVDNTDTVISDLSIAYKNESYDFTGDIDIQYFDISSLFSLDIDNLSLKSNLRRNNTDNYINGSFIDGSYSLDLDLDFSKKLRINALGLLNSGMFAECSFDNNQFDLKYSNGNLVLENASGTFDSLQFNDLSLDLNIIDRSVLCSFSLLNELENYDSVIKQGGRFQIKAKLDSLVLGALNLAGIDAEASFELSIYDAFLGDGFNLTDTSLDVTFSRSNVRFSGNLINGYILPFDKYLNITIDKEFLFGFNAEGYFDDNLEIYLSDIYFPLQLIDQFINTPFYTTYGGIIQGDLLLNGSLSDPSFYGMLYSQAFSMGLLFIPNQKLSLKNVVISAVDHSFHISRIPVVGHSDIDGRYYNGNVSVDLNLGALSLDSMDLYLDVFEKPIDLWIPLLIDETNDLDIRGDVVGTLHFYYKDNIVGVDSDIIADNANVTFRIEDKPDWMVESDVYINTNVNLTSGKNVEFYYPSKNNSFMNFTVEEGNTVNIQYDVNTNELFALGSFDIKSGRISYINNDFVITEGKCNFSKDLNGEFAFNVDLLANIREYDYNGNRMDIYLSLNNANLNNINPHFTSIPSLTENEILQVLASSVIPSKSEDLSFSNIANAALLAARAASNLGIVNNIKDYSLNSVVRNSLMLDIFSARSLILENIIIDSITYKDDDVSLLAKYLNGTSLFAGKYFGNDLFARMTVLLRSSTNDELLENTGHILTSDLNLDFEFSIEWDNPFGEFAIFTKPQELSIFDFLDTIGFSVTKRFSF